MSAFQWVQLILSGLGAIVLPLAFFALKITWTIRANDLHDLQRRLDRIERKLDEHLQFHAESRPHA